MSLRESSCYALLRVIPSSPRGQYFLFVEQAIDLLCIQVMRGHSSLGRLTELAPRRGFADWQVKRGDGLDRLERRDFVEADAPVSPLQ